MTGVCECFVLICVFVFRYRLSGLILPSLKDWFEGTFGASLQHKSPATVNNSVSYRLLFHICV